jgi:2-oxoglutarate ferredoxin oxidoreductase subunit alpha
VVKVNSYAHDETGITTEEAAIVAQMTRKRLRKAAHLAEAMEAYDTVITDGPVHAGTMLVCWGSVQGACTEAAHELGLRAVRPVVLSPFPEIRLKQALEGARRLISVEENATGQLAALLRLHGITVDTMVLQYDGRPLTPEMLVERLKEAGL